MKLTKENVRVGLRVKSVSSWTGRVMRGTVVVHHPESVQVRWDNHDYGDGILMWDEDAIANASRLQIIEEKR